ncbi:SRPBCC family protein [Arcticibacter sp.]|uniref:SRPBCC family protein n=1 Tax=Arcticibacter sp. TaxID=1872630 RepID=UPI00388D02DF
MDNFSTSLIFQEKEDKIYDGLTTYISAWWTDMFEGSANMEGQTFTIRFGPQVFKTIRVEELIKNKKVAWRVVDALIDLPELGNKKEWVNTRIIWELSTHSNGTALRVTHIGLTPEAECYELCSSGWKSFLYSFNKFINTGVGTPFTLAEAD